MSETEFKSLNLPKAGETDLDSYMQERGVPEMKKPQASEPQVRSVPVVVPQSTPTRRVPVEVSDELARELRKVAAERGCTIRFLIVEALHKSGWDVPAGDLQEDGRRRVL